MLLLMAGAVTAQTPEPTARFDTFGWTRLFDGRSLSGWTEVGGRYDGNAEWRVEDGAIVGRQGKGAKGGLLYTDRRYANFVLSLEVKLKHPFDSGIFVRMVSPPGGKGAQITLDDRPEGEIAAVYSDGYLQHNRTGAARWRRDAWNRVEVRCTGHDMHLEAWLNGTKVTDYRVPDGTPDFARNGRIGLQVHGGGNAGPDACAMFRDVYLQELPYFDDRQFDCDAFGFLTPNEASVKAGWRALFNGSDMSGFEIIGDPRGYETVSGQLLFPRGYGDGFCFTTEEFDDFELRLDFRLGRAANSGLFLRGKRGGGDPAYSGCEIQILDDFNFEADNRYKLRPTQFCGSLYAAAPPIVKDALNPPGMWNTYLVRYEGSRLRVELNGFELYDLDTHALKASPPFQERPQRGFIGLQRHTPSQVEGKYFVTFRNFYIRPLPRQR